jgi:hypothetical protein
MLWGASIKDVRHCTQLVFILKWDLTTYPQLASNLPSFCLPSSRRYRCVLPYLPYYPCTEVGNENLEVDLLWSLCLLSVSVWVVPPAHLLFKVGFLEKEELNLKGISFFFFFKGGKFILAVLEVQSMAGWLHCFWVIVKQYITTEGRGEVKLLISRQLWSREWERGNGQGWDIFKVTSPVTYFLKRDPTSHHLLTIPSNYKLIH